MSTPFNGWANDAGFDAEIEQLEPKELVVHGKIPQYAAGTLYRAGPGNYRIKRDKKDFSVSHWFDGFSHLYRFQIIPTDNEKCKVIYNSRRQVDGLIDEVRKTGKLDKITFAQKRDPCESFFSKMKSVFAPSGRSSMPDQSNACVTVIPNPPNYGGLKSPPSETKNDRKVKTLITLSDYNVIKSMDPETLEPMGVVDQTVLHPALNGVLSAAHAQFDPETGDLFNYNLAFGVSSVYRIFKTSAMTGKTEILATIQDPDVKGAYIHSFFLSADFVILAIWTAHIAGGGISILWERNILDAIKKFDPNTETTWLVVDRRHGRGLVAKFRSPASFSFHSINAYQEERSDGTTDIFCDVVCFPNLDVLHRFYYDNLKATGPGVHDYAGLKNKWVNPIFVRHHLAGVPTGDKKTELPKIVPKTTIAISFPGPDIGELPTFNGAYKTKKQRYVYSVVDRGLSSLFDGIGKTDIETRKAVFWGVSHHTPGEPIFVRNPEGEAEDDGVLLSVVLDGDRGTSYLVCLDARTMTELGRAEVETAVGMGFHGRHVRL